MGRTSTMGRTDKRYFYNDLWEFLDEYKFDNYTEV
jgi:hypothetical protein